MNKKKDRVFGRREDRHRDGETRRREKTENRKEKAYHENMKKEKNTKNPPRSTAGRQRTERIFKQGLPACGRQVRDFKR